MANAELTEATRLVIPDLTTGDVLNIRVVAVNPGGPSEPAVLAEPVPIRELGGELIICMFWCLYRGENNQATDLV